MHRSESFTISVTVYFIHLKINKYYLNFKLTTILGKTRKELKLQDRYIEIGQSHRNKLKKSDRLDLLFLSLKSKVKCRFRESSVKTLIIKDGHIGLHF